MDLDFYNVWPEALHPCFFIETCFDCAKHQWCTRHNQDKYLTTAANLKKALMEELEINESLVLINKFHIDLGQVG